LSEPEYVDLLPPHLVPSGEVFRQALESAAYQRCRALNLASKAWQTNVCAADELDAALSSVAFRPTTIAVETAPRGDVIHDAFFHCRRVDGNRAEIFLRMVLWSNYLLLREVHDAPGVLPVHKLELMDRAFSVLLSRLLGVDPGSSERVAAWRTDGDAIVPIRRWKRGHAVFFALTQGLILAFSDLRDAIADDDVAGRDAAVALVVALLRGSGASMEFTGSIAVEDFLSIIRPSMGPPALDESLSGLLSTDHRIFIGLVREMKPLLDELARRSPAAHELIAQSVRDVYDAHRFVCERLVAGEPSLMTVAARQSTPGGEQIEKFKRLRLKTFETAAR
jgi:hypothetical protein